MKHEVEIALQSSSGEEKSSVVLEKLLNQFIKQLKQEEKLVRAENKAGRDKRQATDNAGCFGLIVFVIKLFFVVFSIIFLLAVFEEFAKRYSMLLNKRK